MTNSKIKHVIPTNHKNCIKVDTKDSPKDSKNAIPTVKTVEKPIQTKKITKFIEAICAVITVNFVKYRLV